MFKDLKLKIGTRRIKNKSHKTKSANRAGGRKPTLLRRIWDIVCWPFRMLRALMVRFWAWIRTVDLIGMINLTLLVAIIVLFLLLIIDIIGCGKKQTVVVTDVPSVTIVADKPQITVTNSLAPTELVRPKLPLKRDPITRKFEKHTVSVAKNKCGNRPQAEIYGDVIIDRRGECPTLTDNVHIHGSLYLQNMHKYTLPCGAVIDGNLFLRDLGMLQFCGDFTVRGNIYVSPRSSFGPIPRTARIGGQIIL
ncbi:hypothetical protein HDR61_05120 [bacterium]|nr:hypothetical protein [bacterium]